MKQYIPGDVLLYTNLLELYCTNMVDEEYRENVCEFMCLDTMEQRFRDTRVLFCEHQGKQAEWERIILAPAKWDCNGKLEKVVFAVLNITEQKQREEKMQYKIEHDELTGTLSRTAFNRATEILENSEEPFAFVLLDIDKFKTINDTYGHDVGDAVLSCLVSVLNRKIGLSGRLFRLGGDEFAIIMNRLTLEQADYVKQLIEAVNVLTTSGVDGLPEFSISAGVTFSDRGYHEMLYRNADQALYYTKETGRRGCTVFEDIK